MSTFHRHVAAMHGRWTLAAISGGATLALLLATAGCAAPKGRPAGVKALPRWEQAQLAVAKRLAEENLAAGKFDRASSALAAFERTGDESTQLTLARIDVERGAYDAALERIERAISRRRPSRDAASTSEAEFHQLRGVCLEALGRTQDAVASYERAWAIAPSATALAAWADTLALGGRADDARALISKYRERFPGDVQVCEVAARLRLTACDAAGAARELKNGAADVADAPSVARRIAETHMRSGEYAAAAEIWRKLLAPEKDAAARRSIQRALAASELASGHADDARRLYRELIGQDANDHAAQLGLATASLAGGDTHEALGAARAAEDGDSTAGAAHLLRALCHERLGDRAQAVRIASTIHDPAFSDEVRELLRRCDAQ